MKVPGIVKKLYGVMALLALVSMLAIGGVLAVATASGALTGEKIQLMADIMRSDELPSEGDEAEPETAPSVVEEEDAPADVADQSQDNEELMRREAERIKEELAQRIAQVNRVLLLVTMKREEFEKQQEEALKREENLASQREEAGFRKLVDLFNGLSEKAAVEMLLSLDDPDDAARILMEMEERKATKMIEAAKKSNNMTRMQEILKRIKEVGPTPEQPE